MEHLKVTLSQLRLEGKYKKTGNQVQFIRGCKRALIFGQGVELFQVHETKFIVKGSIHHRLRSTVFSFGEDFHVFTLSTNIVKNKNAFQVTNSHTGYKIKKVEDIRPVIATKTATIERLIKEHTQGSKKAVKTQSGYDILYTYQNGSTELLFKIHLINYNEDEKYFITEGKNYKEI